MTVDVSDILPRKERALDMEPVRKLIAGRNVAITGAGGFIGSELARQIVTFRPKCLTLIDNCEHNLYQIDRWMAEKELHGGTVLSRLGDVRDAIKMVILLRKQDFVFHAAALKHVPLLEQEENRVEANETNINGTINVLASCRCPVVLVSTDKAVRPHSHMGATKKSAEEVIRDSVRGTVVRFGNVLGSTGSVIPLWLEQIARGGPVTVTHAAMTRYFMTVGEAAELILQVAALPRGTYVLDMGAPVSIDQLAKDVIALSGKRGIEIVYTGMRPGERLQEYLAHDEDDLVETGVDGVRAVRTS